jgi:phage terminase large subunit-like protein
MSLPPEVAEAFEYADNVANGRIAACKYVRLACERFLVDVEEAVDGISPWEFNPELAANPIILTEILTNIKGPLARQPIQLMGWQKFAIVNLFGFVERGTTTRRFRQGVIFVPRGNGKTSGIAPIALYLTFAEGEGGA